jgi:hypothetical protein
MQYGSAFARPARLEPRDGDEDRDRAPDTGRRRPASSLSRATSRSRDQIRYARTARSAWRLAAPRRRSVGAEPGPGEIRDATRGRVASRAGRKAGERRRGWNVPPAPQTQERGRVRGRSCLPAKELSARSAARRPSRERYRRGRALLHCRGESGAIGSSARGWGGAEGVVDGLRSRWCWVTAAPRRLLGRE